MFLALYCSAPGSNRRVGGQGDVLAGAVAVSGAEQQPIDMYPCACQCHDVMHDHDACLILGMYVRCSDHHSMDQSVRRDGVQRRG